MEAATLNGFKEPHYKQKWGTKARQGRDMHVTWVLNSRVSDNFRDYKLDGKTSSLLYSHEIIVYQE